MASIYNFSPIKAGQGQTVIINGIGFTGATNVKFGGTNAASFDVISDYQIEAVVAGGSSGNVQVFALADSPVLSGFTFQGILLPEISDFTPTAQVPGQKVSINGENFTGVDTVLFGAVPALFFRVVSDNLIEAYPDNGGTDLITVENNAGPNSLPGFTLLQKQKRLIDLPLLGRAIAAGDLMYVWDGIRNILCQSDTAALPANGTGSGGGSGDTGNIYTALGSPFKVRVGDEDYTYTPDPDNPDTVVGSVTVTDVRLLGKSDYVVSATDAGEFDNDRLTFNPDAGSVTISNYQLTSGRHITVYADGVVTTALQSFLTTQQAQMAKLMLVAAPFLPSLNSDGALANPGGLVAWFRLAIEIPTGWAEWEPGRGYTLRGQDPGDTAYDAATNPDSANRANSSTGGSKTPALLTENNIPAHNHKMFSGSNPVGNLFPDADGVKSVAWTSNHLSGNQDYDIKQAGDDNPSLGHTSNFGKVTPDPIADRLDPFRIVNFIYSTQTVGS